MEAVRAADRDRYLSLLYAPEDKRDALFALYAFNAEISAAFATASGRPLPGEIRLQWWRDVIAEDEAGTATRRRRVAGGDLRHDLPKPAFDNYLEARIFDLYDDPMPGRADLEGYCGETASALIQLAALVLDPRRTAVAEAAGMPVARKRSPGFSAAAAAASQRAANALCRPTFWPPQARRPRRSLPAMTGLQRNAPSPR